MMWLSSEMMSKLCKGMERFWKIWQIVSKLAKVRARRVHGYLRSEDAAKISAAVELVLGT